jgi:hypothetical protein
MSDSASRIPKWVWVTTPTLAVAFIGFILYLATIPAGDELEAVKGDAKKSAETGRGKSQRRSGKRSRQTQL